jgi:hypothetical protein
LWGSGHHVEVRNTLSVYIYWTETKCRKLHCCAWFRSFHWKMNPIIRSLLATFQYYLNILRQVLKKTSFKSQTLLIRGEHGLGKCLNFVFRNCRYWVPDNLFKVVFCVCVCVDYFYELLLSRWDYIYVASDLTKQLTAQRQLVIRSTKLFLRR